MKNNKEMNTSKINSRPTILDIEDMKNGLEREVLCAVTKGIPYCLIRPIIENLLLKVSNGAAAEIESARKKQKEDEADAKEAENVT